MKGWKPASEPSGDPPLGKPPADSGRVFTESDVDFLYRVEAFVRSVTAWDGQQDDQEELLSEIKDRLSAVGEDTEADDLVSAWQCPECGRMINHQLDRCPYSGCPSARGVGTVPSPDDGEARATVEQIADCLESTAKGHQGNTHAAIDRDSLLRWATLLRSALPDLAGVSRHVEREAIARRLYEKYAPPMTPNKGASLPDWPEQTDDERGVWREDADELLRVLSRGEADRG